MGKMKLNQVKLIHNGMNITWHDNETDALRYIVSYMEAQSARVSNTLMSDTTVKCKKDDVDGCETVRVIIYQYYTHYMEVFVLKKV